MVVLGLCWGCRESYVWVIGRVVSKVVLVLFVRLCWGCK